jgi:uncharacterized protein with HEPN domain
MRSDHERLRDMLEAIEAIKKYAARGRSAFDNDELVQTWIIHHLLLLGEAASRLSDPFCQEHPQMPWSGITGMRNIIIHGYFAIDKNIIWSAVEKDVPELETQVRRWLGR